MKLYAGRFREVSSYFGPYQRTYTEVYRRIFGKRFPKVEEACDKFIRRSAFIDSRQFKGPLHVEMPISFCTFLANPGLSDEGRKGEELLTACTFIEDENSQPAVTAYTNYLKQFHHFLLFALQPVPMDVIEMEILQGIPSGIRIDFRNAESIARSIVRSDLQDDEKADLIRKATLNSLMEKQRTELERALDYCVMAQFQPPFLLDVLGVGIQPPAIRHARVEELKLDVLNIEGCLFYAENPKDAVLKGIDWHEHLPKIFDRATERLLDFFREARYTKHIYADTIRMLRGAGQA